VSVHSPPADNPRPAPPRNPDWTVLAGGTAIAVSAAAAYSRTFSVPFLFDDDSSIASNATLRQLATAFRPPSGTTVGGRPVLNLSFALNHALSGNDVWSYHALNLAIHVLAGLTLLGIVRRTLEPRMGRMAASIAFGVALLWTLHPLLTESVTYVVQRAESLMGLFYLLTLYGIIRGASAEGPPRRLWYALSVAACLLGMGTKEVMVSAPLIALLYDRTFLAASFAEALRRRRWVYGALAATWLFLIYLILAADGRGASAGFAVGVPWWSYALAQFPAIVHYLGLCFWPSPLVFDYGTALDNRPSDVVACALAVAALVAATVWALVRRPAVGFLGAAFFALLAPSSSIVPVATEAMAEHRMYLPLIPVIVLVVAVLHGRLARATVPLCVTLAAGLAFATFQRNETYRTEEGIWRDTADKRPGNERAQDNLGFVLSRIPGRLDDAISHYEAALRLKPDFVEAHYNLAYALLSKPGRMDDVISNFEEALRLKPDLVQVRFNLARALETVPGRSDESIAQYQEVVRKAPTFAEARYNLGYMLQAKPGRSEDAAAQFEEFLRMRPDHAGAHFMLACTLQAIPGRLDDAVSHYEEAIRLKPDYVEARCNLGNALNSMGRTTDAISQYSEAVRLAPGAAAVHLNFGIILLGVPGRSGDASAQLREAVRLEPGNRRARQILDRLDASPR
jgi:tetratricopeptide (TPR) repeat protein